MKEEPERVKQDDSEKVTKIFGNLAIGTKNPGQEV